VPLDNVAFWVFAPISVASGVGMLLARNAVHAALFLVVNFFCLAVFFLLLDAPFLFAAQIIVYAGAIMVLFLFVIMLLGVDRNDDLRERLLAQRPLAVLLAVGFIAEIFVAVRAGIGFATKAPDGFDRVNLGGNAQAVARLLFRSYFFPFEVTSILLIVAAIAAMVLAQHKAPAVTQEEIEATRPAEPAESAP
jgi:NADH-quinone oxidoreductase subunit J